MADQLYIKTDGPVADPSITAGKVYPVIRVRPHTVLGLVEILNDDHAILYPMTNGAYRGWSCDYLAEGATWHFCDQHGNPVPAPWEEASKLQACSKECELDPDWPVCGLEFGDDGSGICGNKDSQGMPCGHLESCHKRVNYRAHAEALAKALGMMVEMVEFGGFGKAAAMDAARAALAAFDQDRG